MDDKTTGVGGERTVGRRDEYVTGRDRSELDEGARRAQPGTDPGGAYSASTNRSVAPEQRTREIRAEIEQTREDLSETVDAIQERLRPSTIVSNAADSVRTAASETAEEIADSEVVRRLRANPVPTAMIGVGIAGLTWLAFGGRRGSRRRGRFDGRDSYDWRSTPLLRDDDDSYRTGGRARQGDTSADWESKTNRPAYDSRTYGTRAAGWPANDGITDLQRRARQTTRRASHQVQRAIQESPLLVCAASAVLGAIVGMAAPETERENELMGEARDTVVENVQRAARETAKKVQDAASNAAGLVTDVP
jgi:hypothetical protein